MFKPEKRLCSPGRGMSIDDAIEWMGTDGSRLVFFRAEVPSAENESAADDQYYGKIKVPSAGRSLTADVYDDEHLQPTLKMDTKPYPNLRPARGFCECCGECSLDDRDLVCDHDHRTGLFRGILCRDCNRDLGTFEKYCEILTRYLQKARS